MSILNRKIFSEKYALVKNYKEITKLRHSFNALAEESFGLSFEEFYTSGAWDEHYIPYSITFEGEIVANASANLMTLNLDGKELKAIQIGTVMTHPKFQKKGFAKFLMEEIEKDYENVNLFYLFANDSAVGFYERCEYQRLIETDISILCPVSEEWLDKNTEMDIRVLDTLLESDRLLIERIVRHKSFQSERVGTRKDSALLRFYLQHGFDKKLYYSAALDMIIVASARPDLVHIHDIWSDHPFEYAEIESKLIGFSMGLLSGVNENALNISELKITFGFYINIDESRNQEPVKYLVSDLEEDDSTTFIKLKNVLDLSNIRFPELSHA